jgi:hypothetical protein
MTITIEKGVPVPPHQRPGQTSELTDPIRRMNLDVVGYIAVIG